MVYKLLKRFSIHQVPRWSMSTTGITLTFDVVRYCKIYASVNAVHSLLSVMMWYDRGFRRITYNSLGEYDIYTLPTLVPRHTPFVTCVSNARQIFSEAISWYHAQLEKYKETYAQLYLEFKK